MNKYLIVLLLVAMLFSTGFGQTIMTTSLRKGVYKNYDEFVSNSPSILFEEENLEIEEDQEELVDGITPKFFVAYGTEIKLPIYRLVDKGTKKRIKAKSIWGYCDGSRVFINSYTHIPKHHFVELLLIGRYCYFIQVGYTSNYQPANKFITPFNAVKTVEEYVINLNNGKIFNLDKNLLKVIMGDDQELLNKMNNDPEINRRLLIDYIKDYNARHSDEIKARN